MAEIRINTTGGLKLYDADNSHYAQIVAGTITSNTDVMTLGHAAVVMGTKLDMNGSNLVLDADADTYLDTGTDDTIKFYVSGAHDLTISANAINVLSGTTLTIDSGATITNSGTANGFSSADPASADGDSLGTASLEWSDLFLADGGTIQFGNDQEVRLIHTADTGLILKHTATADDKPISLTLQTGETDIAANDVIGKIDFQAPDEGTGTDAILVAAGIEAVSEGDFSSSNNATKLSFKTAASEAAAEKMSLSSAGLLTVANGLTLSDGDVTVASGHGISFAATADGGGSMSNELLDDYEEGTWTPDITDGTNAMSIDVANGYYTKIGNRVYCNGAVGSSGLGSASGAIRLAGLPFTASSSSNAYGGGSCVYGVGLNITASMNVNLRVELGAAYAMFALWDVTTGTSNMSAAEWSADGNVRFYLSYMV
jgi:hypothetical protein